MVTTGADCHREQLGMLEQGRKRKQAQDGGRMEGTGADSHWARLGMLEQINYWLLNIKALSR